ncbi:hypothetical protein D3C72_404470 [compost metagenome]
MRSPIEKLGIAWSTQPEAGFTPEQDNAAHGPGGGGGAAEVQPREQDRPSASTEQTEAEMVDFPPGNANPALGID